LLREVVVVSEKAAISEQVQTFLKKSDWKSAIAGMEKLFAIDGDPLIRVRIGDVYQKLNRKSDAVREYMHAADLYAERGFVVKALAQYKLALRIDPTSKTIQEKIEGLHSHKAVKEEKREPVEEGALQPTQSVIPLFSDFTQEEFNEFTKRMILHTLPSGKTILKEGDTGRSVFILTRGSVRVISTIQGKLVELALLSPSDFFGEIAFLTGKPRTATVETVVESDILEVEEQDLKELIYHRPRIQEVLQNYYQMRVQSTIEKVKEMI
jgi:signal-transduction protein with cAMP-binding, CBS, and nucleotidyltransferase domain